MKIHGSGFKGLLLGLSMVLNNQKILRVPQRKRVNPTPPLSSHFPNTQRTQSKNSGNKSPCAPRRPVLSCVMTGRLGLGRVVTKEPRSAGSQRHPQTTTARFTSGNHAGPFVHLSIHASHSTMTYKTTHKNKSSFRKPSKD